MGPVRQNPIQRTVKTAHLSVLTTSVHNTAQNSSDNLSSYIQITIIAQTLSIEGQGGVCHAICMFTPQVFAATHCAYPQRDGQTEFTWMACYIAQGGLPVHRPSVTHQVLTVPDVQELRVIDTTALPPGRV